MAVTRSSWEPVYCHANNGFMTLEQLRIPEDSSDFIGPFCLYDHEAKTPQKLPGSHNATTF
jgi:hypothetical protein